MKFANLRDQSLKAFHESIRRQVGADKLSEHRYRLMGDSAKLYAEELETEMERRRISFTPIEWPVH
jgi:hypothetical protein